MNRSFFVNKCALFFLLFLFFADKAAGHGDLLQKGEKICIFPLENNDANCPQERRSVLLVSAGKQLLASVIEETDDDNCSGGEDDKDRLTSLQRLQKDSNNPDDLSALHRDAIARGRLTKEMMQDSLREAFEKAFCPNSHST